MPPRRAPREQGKEVKVVKPRRKVIEVAQIDPLALQEMVEKAVKDALQTVQRLPQGEAAAALKTGPAVSFFALMSLLTRTTMGLLQYAGLVMLTRRLAASGNYSVMSLSAIISIMAARLLPEGTPAHLRESIEVAAHHFGATLIQLLTSRMDLTAEALSQSWAGSVVRWMSLDLGDKMTRAVLTLFMNTCATVMLQQLLLRPSQAMWVRVCFVTDWLRGAAPGMRTILGSKEAQAMLPKAWVDKVTRVGTKVHGALTHVHEALWKCLGNKSTLEDVGKILDGNKLRRVVDVDPPPRPINVTAGDKKMIEDFGKILTGNKLRRIVDLDPPADPRT